MNDQNTQALQEAQANADRLTTALAGLDKTIEKLNASQQELTQTFQDYSKSLKDSNDYLQKAEDAVKAVNLQFDKTAAVVKSSNGSLQQNKALLDQLLEKYELLDATQGDNSKSVKALNVQIGQLSATISDQEEKLAKSRETIDFHKKSLDALKSSFETIKDSAGKFAPALDSLSTGFNAMKDGLSVVKTGFQDVGSAIKTTGFGLLVIVLQSVVEYLTKTREGSKLLNGTLAAISKVVSIVEGAFSALKISIGDALMHPIDSIKAVWNGLLENLANRFKAIGVILNGIKNFDLKKVTDGVIQLGSGITNATDKVRNAYKNTKDFVVKSTADIVTAYKAGSDAAGKAADDQVKTHATETAIHQDRIKQAAQKKQMHKNDADELGSSQARMSEIILSNYAKEITAADEHFKALEEKYKKSATKIAQLEKAKAASIAAINKKFQDEDIKKLTDYENELRDISDTAGKTAEQLAIQQLQDTYDAKIVIINKEIADAEERRKAQGASKADDDIINRANQLKEKLEAKLSKDKQTTSNSFTKAATDKAAQDVESNTETDLQTSIGKAQGSGHNIRALELQKQLLDAQYKAAIAAAQKAGTDTAKIDADFAKKKADIESQLTESKIHAGDQYIDAILKNTSKESTIYKAAFMAKKATSIADVIVSTKKSIISSFEGYSSMPFIGQALAIAQGAFIAAQGAASITTIAKQKPGFAQGGQFVSDGRGALLSGYSRTDNTNAYLRSGEAVVVSEAMRNPWARNLVSAINVAHGGRDFSTPNPGRGYAIGGIFSDGGNANRYYSQPMNDVKDLANTMAYQMINNFPPIYVDVKDVNNQQNILAQTVNRVNL